MSTTFESLTKEAKEYYHKFFRLYNDEGDYSNALVSARIFVEFIAKAGIYEICHNHYDDILFQQLEDKGRILIQHDRKDYYTVKPEDIDNARTGENGNKKATGHILKGNNGYEISQIDYNTIKDSFIYKFESSGLIKIFGAFIEQINQEAYYNFKTSNTYLSDLFYKANPGAHSTNKDEQEKAAYDVNFLLQSCTLNLLRFCEKNAKTSLCDTAIFLKDLIGNTERTISSSAKTPSNRPAQQNRSYNGYSKQPQNATADINKHKEEELRRQKEEDIRKRQEKKQKEDNELEQAFYSLLADYNSQQQEEAERAKRQKEADLKRQQEEAERARRQKEAELKRQQEEAERARRQVEAELKRQQEEAERAKRQKEADLKRQQEEAERAKRQREAELKRLQEEAERAKRQKEAELKRQQEEAERAKRQREADLKRQQEEAERAKRQREAERARRQREVKLKENEILEKASDLRNTFLGSILCVAFILPYMHTRNFESPMVMYIFTICAIIFIPLAYFLVIQSVHMLFDEKEFLTKPFIHQAEKFHKICVPDDYKWVLIRFSPLLVTAIIAIVILFFTDNAIIPVLIGLFGTTCSAYCFAFFNTQLLKSQTIYYPKPTHWISTFITALITFSIPAVIYLLFFA